MGCFSSQCLRGTLDSSENNSSRERYISGGTYYNNKLRFPKADFNRDILPEMPQDARNTLSGGGRLNVTVTYGQQNSWQFVLAEDDDDQSRYKIEGDSWPDVLRTTDLVVNDNFRLRYDNQLTFEFKKLSNIIRIDDFNNNKLRFPKADFNRDILPKLPQDARNTLSGGGRLDVTVTYGQQNSWQFVTVTNRQQSSWQFVLAEDDDDQSRYKIEGNSWEDFLRTTDLVINDKLRYIGGEDNPRTFELVKSGNIRIEEVSQ